jgi:tRNA(Arg) A34 adenosine deaminase TadA
VRNEGKKPEVTFQDEPSWLRLARKHLKKCRHSTFWHIAVVRKGGKILGIGANHEQTHAEVAAIRRCKPHALKNAEVLSLRFSLTGKLTQARPCENCQKALYAAGIRRVIYSVPFDQLERMSLVGVS